LAEPELPVTGFGGAGFSLRQPCGEGAGSKFLPLNSLKINLILPFFFL
jgi:hypothetical protein